MPQKGGFWDGVDLRLGAIEQTNARKRERERERERGGGERQSKNHQQQSIKEYKESKVRMHENA